eukprot:TRINITY_DN16229_c0_g1_i1.p1 TRINITY_DN16229_c0_g1~~TRINITY_DN16229_c0_g1_i1.p1  ORF type:complete len:618 (+),score=47.51 TRINITY_DN16229_c0_g1_i1:46-1899(+)
MGSKTKTVQDEASEPEIAAVGLHARRGCTDVLFLIVFIAAMLGYAVLCSIAYETGNPWRLIYGTDYLGNVCGLHGSRNAPRLPNVTDWGNRTILWYPFDLDDTENLDSVMNMGICVKECPELNEIVTVYPDPSNVTNGMPKSFRSEYSSATKIRRCIPDRTNNSAVIQKLNDVIDLFDISDLYFEASADVKAAEKIITYSMLVCVGLSITWLVLVYFLSLPMIICNILAVLGGLSYGGYLLFKYSKTLEDDGDDNSKYAFGGAIVLWVLAGVFLLVCVFMAGKIRKGAKIAEEGSGMLLSVPSVVILPLFFVSVLILWICLGILAFLFIQTMEAREVESYSWAGKTMEGYVQKIPQNRYYFHAYNFVMFVWGSIFLLDTGFLCIALVASYWYFSSEAGEPKKPPCFSPIIAMGSATIHHLGTTAIGSLIITICKVVRWALMRLEDKLKGTGLDCVSKFACCCVCCLENCLKFLSEKAYVLTAIEGTNFCSSAKRAVSLIVDNFMCVAVVEIVTAFMVFLGKVIIIASTVIFAYFSLTSWMPPSPAPGLWAPLLFVLVCAYIICSVFVIMFSTVVDTLVLCHCADKDYYEEPKHSNEQTRNIAQSCSKHENYEPTHEA